jgi:hypothetical protein
MLARAAKVSHRVTETAALAICLRVAEHGLMVIPERSHVSPPMVYVYEQQRWEYKVVAKKLRASMPEDELNALGDVAGSWRE